MGHLQVVERKASRMESRHIKPRREPGDEVIDVVVAFIGANDAKGAH